LDEILGFRVAIAMMVAGLNMIQIPSVSRSEQFDSTTSSILCIAQRITRSKACDKTAPVAGELCNSFES
jgi:hypothetical protein